MKKFLPIGIHDFTQMIEGNFVYVDKTRYIYELARIPQAFYFLSRPRRFGKSLLVSTLQSLFEGKQEFFKGLWIENSDWVWKPHPVIKIDFSEIQLTDAKTLEQSLVAALDQLAAPFAIKLKQTLLANKFVELLTELSNKLGEKVVILIDEYDKPIIAHLGKGEEGLQIARQSREILKNFFGVLKGGNVADLIRFIFITGISKFSRVGIFSDLNNLQDLSMHAAYAGLLGYTHEDLEKYFNDWIEEFARLRQTTTGEILQLLRAWYNGHRFTKLDLQVYNPFSLLNVFSEYDFKNFWFETGTPSFLANLIKEKDYPISNIENLEVQEMAFSTYELENLQLEALLFQTGYITIHGFDGFLYRLGYPNQEVKTSFLSYLYQRLVEISNTTLKAQYIRLHEFLAQEDMKQFIETVNAILSAIPYPQIKDQGESYYHTVFYLMLASSGVLVLTEPLSSHGRMDMAVEFKDKVYIVELKCNQSAEEAIRQIREKRYHEKYMQSGRKILLLGINFDSRDRTVKDWRLEKLQA